MTTQELKLSISDLIEDTNDKEILTLVLALLSKLLAPSDNSIVAFEADGTPISEEELIESVLQSSREAKAGRFVSHQEMKAQFGIYE